MSSEAQGQGVMAFRNGETVGTSEQQEQQQQRKPTKMESILALTKSLIIRALIIYFISSFFRRSQSPVNPTHGNDGSTKLSAWNYFLSGTQFDLHVWLSDNPHVVDFSQKSNLIWLQQDLIYGDWYSGPANDGIYHHSTIISATDELLNNGSLYLHAFVTKSGESPNPDASNYAIGGFISHHQKRINKYKRIRVNRNYNLLTTDKEKFAMELTQANIKDSILSHWHPNLTVNIVVDQTVWAKGSVPYPLDEFIKFVDGGHKYMPIVFINDFWNLNRDYFPINTTTLELPLHISFQPLTNFKWQLYVTQQIKNKFGGSIFSDIMIAGSSEQSDEDQDSLKETLMETNIYLFGLTIVISILHSIFEMLAFKNDIQFWNNRKSLEGLSVRSVFFGVFQSVIILLYLLDNDANFMIRVTCFLSLCIELWKVHKVVDINCNTNEKLLGFLPKVSFNDKGSYSDSVTKEYDSLAFKYLGWVCFPLLVGYFIYSLVYNEYKGWYSFILNMMYGYLLTFGFIMMTPQLFINYKLKSVAHLPWRMMTYKFLNTFVDDIFAFVIKMPIMYRLGCFRDDIIFFVFLYQRWQYRVDLKRVNEFGFSGEMIEEAANRQVSIITEDVQNGVVSDTSKTADDKKQD